MRTLVGKRVARGRVELGLSLQLRQTPGVEVEFNEGFGRALEAALDQARARGLVAGALTPGDLLRMPQAITIRDRPVGDDPDAQGAVAAQALDVIAHAIGELDTMRAREGDHLRADVDARTHTRRVVRPKSAQ